MFSDILEKYAPSPEPKVSAEEMARMKAVNKMLVEEYEKNKAGEQGAALSSNGLKTTLEDGCYYYSTDDKVKVAYYGYVEVSYEYLYEGCTEEQQKEIKDKDENGLEFSWLDYMDESSYDAHMAQNVVSMISEDVLSKIGIDFNDIYELTEEGRLTAKSIWRDGYGDIWLVELN